jgi:hypothetical protein
MAEAAFNLADWVSLADVGEHMRQKNDGHRGLARGDVLAALEAGCGVMLRWVGDNGREVCREFPKRGSWEDILVWDGLPQRLCIRLPSDERKGNLQYPHAYLLLTDAVRLGIWRASELPQAKQQSETHDPLLVAAVENRLEAEHRPGKGGNEQWDKFCDEVRKSCGKKATDRGYSDKTIKRIVDALNEQDK